MHLETTATEITQTGNCTKNVQIDRLFFASYGMHAMNMLHLWVF